MSLIKYNPYNEELFIDGVMSRADYVTYISSIMNVTFKDGRAGNEFGVGVKYEFHSKLADIRFDTHSPKLSVYDREDEIEIAGDMVYGTSILPSTYVVPNPINNVSEASPSLLFSIVVIGMFMKKRYFR